MLQIHSRFYVSKTNVPRDLDYFERFDGHSPTNDPCLGLFQRECGKFDIPVVGLNIVSILREDVHPLQKRYIMESGFREDCVRCVQLRIR